MPTLLGVPVPVEPRDRLHVLFGIEAFLSDDRWVDETSVEGVAFELIADLATTVVKLEPTIETTLRPPTVLPSSGRGLRSVMMGDLGTIASTVESYERVLKMFVAGLKRSIVVHGWSLLAALSDVVLCEIESEFVGNERAERELLKVRLSTALGARRPVPLRSVAVSVDDQVRISLDGLRARPVM